jgi:hypothetical protein
MKERELTKDAPAETTPRDHPYGAVDFELGRITSENLKTSDGMDAPEPVPRESIDGADQVEEMEV